MPCSNGGVDSRRYGMVDGHPPPRRTHRPGFTPHEGHTKPSSIAAPPLASTSASRSRRRTRAVMYSDTS